MVSMWVVAAVGIFVVFLVLWLLAEVINVLGKYLLSRQALQRAVPEPVGDSMEPNYLTQDMAIIAGIMKHQGITGQLKVTRIDN